MPKFKSADKSDRAQMTRRIYFIGIFFVCCFVTLMGRAISLHLKDNVQLEQVAMRQYRTAVRQNTRRGKILDNLGRELAIDVMADSIYSNPREIDRPAAVAGQLADLLGVDRRKILERLSTNRKFMWIKRRVSDEQSKAVKDLNIPGIYAMRESRRSYPGGVLASSVLGAVGYDAEPLGGIELAYDDVLSTRRLSDDLRRDARGHLYLSPSVDNDAKLADVTLTIDKTLQYIVERELTKAVEVLASKNGIAVMVDVETGAVLAMANVPTFDPNKYDEYDVSTWKNRAVANVYEPGSTFKVVVIASSIEKAGVKANDLYNCEGGRIQIGNDIIRDTHAHGTLSVADIIRVSSNIGTYKVEQKLGREKLYESLRGFGFGKPTGIELPGESGGIFSSPASWSELQFATIAFGQGIATTPLQITMAFATIANGGELLKPYIVKGISLEDGEMMVIGKKQVVNRPIGESTAKVMRDMLKRVTEEGGTGTLAASTEYKMAGKTGTAQKADSKGGGYMKGKYNSSFVGFAPADNAKIALYIGFDEPGSGSYYGGQVAAPVFKDIAEATLRYLKVPGQAKVLTADGSSKKTAADHDVISQELPFIERVGESQPVKKDGEDTWRVPDFRGLTMRGVLAAAGSADIRWVFKGTGLAVRQSVEPGSAVQSGTPCEIEFAPIM